MKRYDLCTAACHITTSKSILTKIKGGVKLGKGNVVVEVEGVPGAVDNNLCGDPYLLGGLVLPPFVSASKDLYR